MLFSALLLVCIVGCAVGQTPPKISETYEADLTVHVQNGTHGIFGRGKEVRDQPAGKAVVQYLFQDGQHPENVYMLERYDLGEYYTIQGREPCMKGPLGNHTMPLQWAWLQNPETKFIEYRKLDGRNTSIFELKVGYAEIGVAVYETIPVAYWRRTQTRNLTVIYEMFNDKAPIDPKARYFDIPRECNSTTTTSSHSSTGSTRATSTTGSTRTSTTGTHSSSSTGSTHTTSTTGFKSGCVSGATMIAAAKVWVDNHVPYSQTGSYQGYRTDCSGYVSMAWELAKPGLTTSTLPGVSKPVAKSALKPGDVLLNRAEHVVLFGGWTDSTMTHYTAYEETQPGEGTVSRVTPYPYWYETSLFLPYSYNNIC